MLREKRTRTLSQWKNDRKFAKRFGESNNLFQIIVEESPVRVRLNIESEFFIGVAVTGRLDRSYNIRIFLNVKVVVTLTPEWFNQ